MTNRWIFGGMLACVAAVLVSPAPATSAEPEPPAVRIAYFIPSDCKPIEGYRERFDRVLTEVQRFFRQGMAAAGYGPVTFRLDREDDGQLRVAIVHGDSPASKYDRQSAWAVRREVKLALAAEGIDVDKQTLVIFEPLLFWHGNKTVEAGPYCGSGNHLAGTAWVYDDAMLDPRQLRSKEPGGYYNGPCSVGQFNSHYIGGVAHELGHGLGLPHVCQRNADRKRGKALMGGGNHTYGQEQRGEGPGTFLTTASAMLLARSRPFAGEVPLANQPVSSRIEDIKTDAEPGKLVLSGRLVADPPVFGIAAYNDRDDISADYDAVGWTCDVDSDGRFRLEIDEIRPGRHQLRLRPCHTSGAVGLLAFGYSADKTGLPETDIFHYGPLLDQAVEAYASRDRRRAESLASEIIERFPTATDAVRKARHLKALLHPSSPRPLADVPSQEKAVSVADLKFDTATVGWRKPFRNEVLVEKPGNCFLQVDGQFFASGLYAHAPARHVLTPGKRWKQFRTGYGLQDGHSGSVVFVVRGDGRELFRSPTVHDHQLRHLTLDVSHIARLELQVEDAGDGTRSDWGVWIAPELLR